MNNTKKTPCWLTILILTGLGISVSPHQVLTRTHKVSRALSPVLSSYEVIRMAPGEFERQIRTTGEFIEELDAMGRGRHASSKSAAASDR